MGAIDGPCQVQAEGVPAEGPGQEKPHTETEDAVAQEQQRLAKGEGMVWGPCRKVRPGAAPGDEVDHPHQQQDLD